MTVRITFRGSPRCTHLYGGVVKVISDGTALVLHDARLGCVMVTLASVAEIALEGTE